MVARKSNGESLTVTLSVRTWIALVLLAVGLGATQALMSSEISGLRRDVDRMTQDIRELRE